MIGHDHGTAGPAQTAVTAQSAAPPNTSTGSVCPSYDQKLYAPSAPATQYAPQYASPTVPEAPTVGPAPTATSPQVVASQPPPPPAPPQVEVVPVSPGPTYYWVPGYWAWRAGGWVWVPGVWVRPPHHGAVWVSGHWAQHGHGYVWVGGSWH
jgi:hypothetical protein